MALGILTLDVRMSRRNDLIESRCWKYDVEGQDKTTSTYVRIVVTASRDFLLRIEFRKLGRYPNRIGNLNGFHQSAGDLKFMIGKRVRTNKLPSITT